MQDQFTDWRDQIPWDMLVDEIEWVAGDLDGGWWGYKEEPQKMSAQAWGVEGRCFELNGIKTMPSVPANWTQAIAKRPERSK